MDELIVCILSLLLFSSQLCELPSQMVEFLH